MMYYDLSRNHLTSNIIGDISEDHIRSANYGNHFMNTRFLVPSPNLYLPVLPNIYTIPPRSSWYLNNSKFYCAESLKVSNNRYNFDLILEKLISSLKKYNIAVELSGGLDSSIIIGVFRQFGIDPYLIGFISNKYEFRTERFIQSKLTQSSSRFDLIESESIHPCKNLLNTPFHQLPYHSSLWYYAKEEIANRCRLNNIDILFNGMSGDTIFCNEVGEGFPYAWLSWQMDYGWFNQYVFSQNNVKYLPAYSKILAEEIFYLRKNQGYDAKKIWARKYFRKYLPSELVNYYYKADHIVEFLDGFKKAYKEIETLFYVANDFLKSNDFSSEQYYKLYDQVDKYDSEQIHTIFSKVSFANWIYSILNNVKGCK